MGPYEGIQILEISESIAVSYGAMLLAELGADVGAVDGLRLQVVPVRGRQNARSHARHLVAALAPTGLGVEVEEWADGEQPGPRCVGVDGQLEVSREREV